ncbi:hypothetical protein NQ176_g28 [Zarea fungicola]|uniref:Uncharacterized protein n=1 Tax=Zarea fungicola TaxID=93591 RepID=A0ACC1P0V2_9HYPO|nr:hypothetical protein NQ176_g28 [Lecanicillium fungicola]
MRWSWLRIVPLLTPLLQASPVADIQAATYSSLPRLVVYFQTTHDQNGNPISMLPLINEKGIALTHLIVCSFHINRDSEVHLNDYPPDDPHFYTLWNETAYMKQAGVKVMGMVGGAAAGSFDQTTLDGDTATFEKYYDQLRDIIQKFALDGMDLDVEQPMSQPGITRLVTRLRKDFGPRFILTLAPVASALENGANLSGFSYKTLESSQSGDISFYNSQFYSGFGTMASTGDYVKSVSNGFDASKLVAGQLTAPANGYGFIPYSQLNATVLSLLDTYGKIGGIMGWEYFNSVPGGLAEPWKWAQVMTEILRPNSVPKLRITSTDAKKLTEAYDHSVGSGSPNLRPEIPAVDYYAMINA